MFYAKYSNKVEAATRRKSSGLQFMIASRCYYMTPNILAVHEIMPQSRSPVTVGIAIAASVHFHEPVSFFMVRQEVEQGKWQSMNTITHSAVTYVQPFRPRISASIAVSPASVSVL